MLYAQHGVAIERKHGSEAKASAAAMASSAAAAWRGGNWQQRSNQHGKRRGSMALRANIEQASAAAKEISGVAGSNSSVA